MKIGAQHAVVFGLDAAQIDTHSRHATAAIGKQDEVGGTGDVEHGASTLRSAAAEDGWRVIRIGSEEVEASFGVWVAIGVAFEKEFGFGMIRTPARVDPKRKASDMAVANGH